MQVAPRRSVNVYEETELKGATWARIAEGLWIKRTAKDGTNVANDVDTVKSLSPKND